MNRNSKGNSITGAVMLIAFAALVMYTIVVDLHPTMDVPLYKQVSPLIKIGK